MTAVERLEALISIENDLKTQYEEKLQIEAEKAAALSKKIEELEATVAKQLATISDMSVNANEFKRLEQANRELGNRAEKAQTEADKHKARAKELQKEAGSLKSEVKDLKQFDAAKVKKNLVDTKKKLQEQTKANELLNKTNKETKNENFRLKQENESLKAELEKLKPAEENSENDVAPQEDAA